MVISGPPGEHEYIDQTGSGASCLCNKPVRCICAEVARLAPPKLRGQISPACPLLTCWTDLASATSCADCFRGGLGG